MRERRSAPGSLVRFSAGFEAEADSSPISTWALRRV